MMAAFKYANRNKMSTLCIYIQNLYAEGLAHIRDSRNVQLAFIFQNTDVEQRQTWNLLLAS